MFRKDADITTKEKSMFEASNDNQLLWTVRTILQGTQGEVVAFYLRFPFHLDFWIIKAKSSQTSLSKYSISNFVVDETVACILKIPIEQITI